MTYEKLTRALTDRKLNDERVRNIPRNSAPLIIPSEKKRKTCSRKSQRTPLRWEIRINRNDAMPRHNLHSPFSIKRTIVIEGMMLFYEKFVYVGSDLSLCSSCSLVPPPSSRNLLHLPILSPFLFFPFSVLFHPL